MLGQYQNFPETIRAAARFTHRISTRKLQYTILETLHQLNEKTLDLSAITPFSSAKCDASFEFGAAEGITFNYLDQKEMERFQQSVAKKALPILDLFCVIRYHIIKRGKRVPLKFDYHLLRLIFYKNNMELQVIHERGSQRVSLEDLITFMKKRINEQLSKRGLKLLNLKEL